MNFDPYIVKDTNLSLTMSLNCPPPKASHNKGLKGFTLAEILLTLTIIGVIAAMTVPTLLLNHQKQQFVVGLKKAHSTISNAVQMIPINENCPAGDYDCCDFFSHETDNSLKLLAKNLKIKAYYPATDDTRPDFCKNFAEGNCIYTDDGMVFSSYIHNYVVDVNGEKGPNKYGRDRFLFLVNNGHMNEFHLGAVIPFGTPGTGGNIANCTTNSVNNNETNNITLLHSSNTALSCTARVLNENAMNY